MRNFVLVMTVFLMLVPALFAQDAPPAAKSSAEKASGDVRFHVDMLDKNVDP